MATNKEVAEKKTQEVTEYAGYEEYAGAGFENQTSDDYALPFINILQSNSPQVEEDETLRAGMIFNTVTGEVWSGKDGVAFIPCITDHNYVEFKPRDAGGGYVGVHAVDSDLVADCVANQPFGEYRTPAGNELVETFYVYGILVDSEGNGQECVIPFTSSKIKKYKKWQTKAKTIQMKTVDGRRFPAPLFAHRYRLTTVTEKNIHGTYANWQIDFDGENAPACRLSPEDPLFQQAVGCKEMVQSGVARAAHESQTVRDVGGGEGGGATAGAGDATGAKPKF